MKNKNRIFLTVFILSGIFAIPTSAVSDVGIEPVSVYVNAKPEGVAFNPNEKITISTGNEIRLSILFRSTSTGDNKKYIIRAPFARVITTTSGTLSDENGLSTLDISTSRGQSFTIDLIGTVTEPTYIDIFKKGVNLEAVGHFTIVPDTEIYTTQQENVPEKSHPSLNRQIAIAEENINKLKKLGKTSPLWEAELENARLYSIQNPDRAASILDKIITETSSLLEKYNNLKSRLEVLKEKAEYRGILKEVGPLLLSAERSLLNMDLTGAESHLNEAEKLANPGWLQTIINQYGTYIWIAVAVLVIGFVFKLFMQNNEIKIKI